MGTSNFYYKNASKVYAICMNSEQPKLDDDGNETEEMETVYAEQEDYNDTRDYVAEKMKEVEGYNFSTLSGSPNNDLRSFEGSLIGQWSIDKTYGDVNVEVIIVACSRAGYYEGACLDWYIDTYICGYENDDINADDFEHYSDKMNAGMAKIIAPKANKWIETMKDKMAADLEKVFAECCGIELEVVATFSNGETIYKKAS